MGKERFGRPALSVVRLHITAEGQTEQAFVKTILAPHLGAFGVFADARCVMTGRDKRIGKTYRGGLISYKKAKSDIVNWLKEDGHADCRFSTMFDLYHLPKDFPGYSNAARQTDPYSRIGVLEEALRGDINDRRFIPHIQLHEFEALIFADVRQLDWEYLDHEAPIQRLENVLNTTRDQNPELIDDNPETAPSKRIIREIPEYDKANAGVLVAQKIGLPVMTSQCSHFRDWVESLERLAQTS